MPIRPATPVDVPAIIDLIRGLSRYEKLEEHCSPDPARLREHLFGPKPYAEALLAEADGESHPVGVAIFFHTYSTFSCRPGFFLEDIFVKPEFRGHGFGKALMEKLFDIARERDCENVEWLVLDWNQPAMEFYNRLGAGPVKGWTIYNIDL
jgi:GNAT superfamily N-acetyltransferase